MNWASRRVLVTGAGGFIGSHLVEELVRRGASVCAFIRYNSRSDDALLAFLPADIRREVEVVRSDLRDEAAVREAMRGTSTVFHLGALVAIPYSYLHPREVVDTNVAGTLNVLLAARDAEVERVIHTSSSEVYGTALRVPIDESHPLQGQSPYSASKIGADKLVESFVRSFGLPATTVRPFNTYGPRQSARAVIPTIITQALTSDVIRLGNLGSRRDFTYVDDIVAGFLAAAHCGAAVGEVFNLGSGEDISVGELAQLVADLMGRSIPVRSEPERKRPEASEVQQLVASAERAHRLLGWRPSIPFREGLIRSIEWISQHISLYDPQRYQI